MIRQATINDAEQIVCIYNHYILNSVATFEDTEITTPVMAERLQKVQADSLPWLVATENNDVAGYAYATKWNSRSAYQHTVEITVYVSPTVLSNGIGGELYSELFSMLHQRGIHVVLAGITLPNAASIALHEKYGMEKVGHLKEVGYKFGEWLDVGYWQVRLNA